jgi:hypothetical protein
MILRLDILIVKILFQGRMTKSLKAPKVLI